MSAPIGFAVLSVPKSGSRGSLEFARFAGRGGSLNPHSEAVRDYAAVLVRTLVRISLCILKQII